MINKRFKISLVLITIWLLPSIAGAIPSLGVAPTSGGTYYGPYETYLDYFADTFVDPFGGNAGFLVPESGGSLTVWYGTNSGSVDTNVHIYLATNSPYAADGGFSYGGTDFSFVQSPAQADGYHRYNNSNYFIVDLGTVGGQGSSWSLFADGGWSGEWYVYTADIVYDGFSTDQKDWFFAIADMDKDGKIFENGADDFSPKTASSNYPVPEPATMLLLGTGLIGLAGLRRKKLLKGRS